MPSEPLHARSPKRRFPFLSLSALSEASLSQAQGFALLALVCLVSLFLFMGDTLFNTRGEPREAVVALSMLQDGNWILPVNNGVDLAYKPPLLHWLVALCSLPLGEVTELTARMPSALALSGMLLGLYAFLAPRRGVHTALLASVLTLTCFEVHRAGLTCRVDMLLAALTVGALLLLYVWHERGRRGVPWWAVLCLSGAFLTKGPVGAALPLAVMVVYGWCQGAPWWRPVLTACWIGALACVLPVAWYVAAWQQGGERFVALVYEENVLRLLGKMSYASHINPWYYHPIMLLAGWVPYTLLAVGALFVVKWRSCPLTTCPWHRLRDWWRSLDSVERFSWLAFGIILVFYCIPKSKRSVYLLPVYPFVGYGMACLCKWLAHEHARLVRGYVWLLAVLAVLLTGVWGLLQVDAVAAVVLQHAGQKAQNVAFVEALRSWPQGVMAWVAVLMPVVAFVAWVRHRRTHRQRMLCAMVVALPLSLHLALDGYYLPRMLNVKSDYYCAQRIKQMVPEGRIYSFRTDVTPGNPMHPFTINFYLGDRIAPYEAFRPAEGYLLAGDADIDAFKERYPQLATSEVMDLQHKSCDDRKMLHFYRFTTLSTAQP